MSNFKVGDEAVCIWDRRKRQEPWGLYFKSLLVLRPGRTYTVVGTHVYPHGLGLSLAEADNPTSDSLWNALYFRKVERRTDKLNLTEWLSQPSGDTDKLDKTRAPAKRRERT